MVKSWVSSRPRAQSSFEVSQREPSIWPWSVVRDFFRDLQSLTVTSPVSLSEKNSNFQPLGLF